MSRTVVGMDINRNAPVVVELDITVAAPLDRVWALHTAVDEWPGWNAEITRARLDGEFTPGAVFEWETAGLAITSTVQEVEPARRTVWGGPVSGIDGVHVWTFEEAPDGVRVHTAESWDGEPVRADPAGLGAALRASLEAWLAALKAAGEKG
jgi:uncharacterized protein YndB with AHSA1/START domain